MTATRPRPARDTFPTDLSGAGKQDIKELAEKFGVQGIPNLTLVKDGKAVTLRERTRTRLVGEIDGLLG